MNIVLGTTDCECPEIYGTKNCTGKNACVFVEQTTKECLPVITDGYSTDIDGNDAKACTEADTKDNLAFYEPNQVCTNGVLSDIPDCYVGKTCVKVGANEDICSPVSDNLCYCGDRSAENLINHTKSCDVTNNVQLDIEACTVSGI